MAQKRYKICAAAAANTKLCPDGALHKLSVMYKNSEGKIIPAKNAPVFEAVSVDAIIGTANDWAQGGMNTSLIPSLMGGNGTTLMFDDVTGTTTPEQVTLNLDASFP